MRRPPRSTRTDTHLPYTTLILSRQEGERTMALKHAKAGEVVDLRPLGDKLKDAKTAAIIKGEGFEAIRLVVRAGREIPSHEVSGNITLHCLEGRVLLGLEQSTIELNAGEWVYLRSEEHTSE